MSKFKKMKLVSLEDKNDTLNIGDKSQDLNNEIHTLIKTIIDKSGDKKGSIKKFRKIIQILDKEENCQLISRKSLTPPKEKKSPEPLLEENEHKWETY